jgi:signal transduction histidine kinase
MLRVPNSRAVNRSAASWSDGLAAQVFAALLVFWAFQIAGSWGPDCWPVDAAAGAVVCAIALARRRHVGRAAAAGLGVAAVTILVARLARLPAEPGPGLVLGLVLGLAVLVGAALRVLPAAWAAVVAAAGLAVVAGTRFAATPPSAERLGDDASAATVLNAAAWLVAVAVGLGLRLLDARRRAGAERVRRDERLALARELHDVVAHHITGIVVQAQAAQLAAARQPPTGPPAGLGASLAGIEAAGSDALTAMRRVVGLLRDTGDAAPARSGPEQLHDLVNRFAGNGRTVRLRVPHGEPGWPPEVTSTVYRLVQESLTNISRHAAHARSVTVSVEQDGPAVTVEVVDDATPAPARYHRTGYGLIGMRERVEHLGGTLDVGPRPGRGWAMLATLPVTVRASERVPVRAPEREAT